MEAEILKALSRGHNNKALQLLTQHGAELSDAGQVSVLFQAALSGHRAVLESVLDLGAPVDSADREGTTALMRAALLKRADCVRALLERGADANRRRADGRTALVDAARGGDTACVGALLDAGGDPESQTQAGDRVITVAANEGKWEAVSLLLESGARANVSLADGTPLVCRIALQAPHLLGRALEAGADMAAVDGFAHRTALHFAATAGRPEAVRELIARGADVEARDKNQWTPLLSALTSTGPDGDVVGTVEALLDAGADLHATTHEGFGALVFSLTRGGRAAFSTLLSAGAPVSPAQPGLPAPLHAAVGRGYVEETNQLLEAGADPEYRAMPGGLTALMAAAASPGDEAVATARILLSRGARVDVWGTDGRSLMALVASHGSMPMARLLLDHGATVHPRDDKDVAPLAVAAARGHLRLVRAFLDAGADPNATGRGGIPLGNAVVWPHAEIVRALLDAGTDPNGGSPPPLIRATQIGTWDDRNPHQRPKSRQHDQAADIVEMLLDAGADPNSTHEGYSALDLAGRFRCPEVVRMIKKAGGSGSQA